MDRKGRKGSGSRRYAALLAAGLLLAAPLAQAQNFESYYGEADSEEFGEDVKSVNVCGGQGSILVGTRIRGDFKEVQVTRVDNNARAMWQNTYRIGDSKQSVGQAIVELSTGRGFAVTGGAQFGPDNYIYVLQIDCAGKPVWATLLDNGKRDQQATGYDIIEGAGDRRFDLIVAGEEIGEGGRRKWGRIARLDAGGNALWNQWYDGLERWPELRFRALTENIAASGAPTDLVVAGNSVSPSGLSSALMFRTDFNGTPVCSATLNNSDQSQALFHGVTALRGRQYPGQSVLVGLNSKVDGGDVRAYLTRFAAGSCNVLAQSLWADPNGQPFRAYDVVEAANIDGGAGGLIVAGTRGTPELGAVFAANPGALDPYLPMMVNYFGGGREMLVSIDRKSNDRVVAAGSTFTDREGVGDPQDMYLVQTDPALATLCKKAWTPKVSIVQFKPQGLESQPMKIEPYHFVDVPNEAVRGEGLACEVDPPENCPGVINNGIVQLGVHKTGYLNVECPAISRSSGTNGGSLVGLRYMPTNGDAASPGSPCEGWGVASADLGITGDTSRCYGTNNVAPVSFAYTPSTAVSVVDVGGTFRVTHKFTPSTTPYLYRVDVSIQNNGSKTVNDLRYTRGIDYDVPPNTFNEYITLAGSSSYVLAWNNNGFNSFNPLAANSGTSGPFTDLGPGDRGAHIDFRFGALAPGQTRSFVTYYGAAGDEPAALGALSSVGASVYSLGQPNWDGTGNPLDAIADPFGSYGYTTGKPATFMYGFDDKSPR
ncbi:hypothetical protein J5226_20095 [Lysobacter sp. K5869]|uniref:hypothetical protein n=1 Tax=Lysobacter sp. K5869 TaxID=2820808 RepID=UPI001C05F74D|nr:hypothetical protein [Lysobacter sp. K5869]QWP75884.1 hypothetical protein J5226_20095 [Lysobacter sp. K5869]